MKRLLLSAIFAVSAVAVIGESPVAAADKLKQEKPVNNMPQVDISQQMKPEVGHSDERIKEAQPGYVPGVSTTGGDFRVTCNPSHMNNDDPIVYPDRESAAHHHTYFGNTTTDYKSTPDILKTTGNSTCFGGVANRSAYWVPSLIDTTNNKPIRPDWALFYYKGGDITPPNGLVIIAGDQTATEDDPQSLHVVDFQCNPHLDGYKSWKNRQNHILPCSGDLVATVQFPNCWDGVNLDSPNHKAHMAYHNGSSCPGSHPKQIPNITYAIHYDVKSTDNLRLASDNYIGGAGGYSFHGDYIFAWNDDVLNTWFENCNGKDKDCHANLLGNGLELY
jgi:hypothetical protein